MVMGKQPSVPIFSGIDRARRRQQSEAVVSHAMPLPPPAVGPIPAPFAPPPPLHRGAKPAPPETLTRADVVLVGAPGIGKSAVWEFLTRHGLTAATVELERGHALPEPLARARGLIVGLMMRPDRLIAERRMRTAARPDKSADIDPQVVREELAAARRLFTEKGWHIIDMSHMSPAAVAARIIAILERRRADTEA